ncbi:MAG: hypothetical protein H0W86_11195 [Armatimonadetes bacterium]|nr:hypothetical protein [Armatimonadota bacterium]
MKDDGTVVAKHEQERERSNGEVVQQQGRQKRSDGDKTQTREQSRTKEVGDDASQAPSPRKSLSYW